MTDMMIGIGRRIAICKAKHLEMKMMMVILILCKKYTHLIEVEEDDWIM